MIRRSWLRIVALSVALWPVLFGLASGTPAQAEEKPDTIKLDYAYYNPSSLVLRRFGWIEEDLKPEGIKVEWVWSAGSNKANEWLRSEAVDFGSTAGSAALLARANGSPIRTVYLYSKPEWTAIVVRKDSDITALEQLKGKKIAATKGTDPYFFLLQTLHTVGLTQKDVEIVNLQHADGKTALERGDVDAWAGLDPYMAQTELEQGSRLIYRNIEFNSWGFLNAREEFLEKHPAYVVRILAQYERARHWILEHPEEAAQILAEEAKLSIDVARRELFDRTVLDINPIPGDEQKAVLARIIPIFEAENQLSPGADATKALEELFDTRFITQVVTPQA
ncbi:MAG: ABC transporter substrate-binding protein [Chloroflexota bacterium]